MNVRHMNDSYLNDSYMNNSLNNTTFFNDNRINTDSNTNNEIYTNPTSFFRNLIDEMRNETSQFVNTN